MCICVSTCVSIYLCLNMGSYEHTCAPMGVCICECEPCVPVSSVCAHIPVGICTHVSLWTPVSVHICELCIPMSMYVPVCAFAYIRVSTRGCAHISVCVPVNVRTYDNAHTHDPMSTCQHVLPVSMHTCKPVCAYEHMCPPLNVCTCEPRCTCEHTHAPVNVHIYVYL